ncbi:apolipoprotein N-acyltransferase [Actinopolymorpha alba]|uniref:apolipoprotein N-acyltransferase n=1 Tax=Actinopolymorpha alba TaxID=533267 RepID=UPI0003603902|nr:apolipoprotein N-acyltransferase [Actinopolymorpha alba]
MALTVDERTVERASVATSATGTRRRMDTLPSRLALAVVAGASLAVTFPPLGWVWLMPFSVAVLTLVCRGVRVRRGALLGFGFGVGFFLVLLQWSRVAGLDGWLALSLVEAAFMAALGAGLTLVTRLRLWPVWAAALWVGVEFARGVFPLGGFPWGRLAFALDDTPMAALASLAGVPFVSFVAALVGNLLLWAVLARGRGLGVRGVAVGAAAALAFGGLLVPLPTAGEGTATVAVVQGNIPGRGLEFLGRARTVTRNHLAATQELMRDVEAGRVPRPDFVLWPENSTDIDPFNDLITRDTVEQAVHTAGVPILVGAILDGPGPYYRRTTGVVWDPKTGPGQTYVKQHPVPFGEYIPFRQLLLPYIDRLQLVGRDTYAGNKPGTMRIAGYDVGEVICFEIAYDGIVREVGQGDSQMLVVQTNNATFTGTGQPQQQFAITRMRAIEYGKEALVASPNGISGIIAPDGKVIAQSKEATRQVYVAKVPLRTTPTLAARLGAVPEWLLIAVGLGAVGLALSRRRRRTSTDPDTDRATPEHKGAA